MAWRGAASRSVIAAVRGRTASSTTSFRTAAPLPSAPRRRVPSFAASSPPLSTARPLAAMMGSPLAVVPRLTDHSAVSVRACCELSQGTLFCRTCQDR
ncbi:hypothetical protein EJB05_05600 [Eragrostis curvula]|uniref:Uncharacterized protein n=1 Tax=Eragrostis curvula TaxID=38414 RepID=A0A5J9WBF6_9POAL|nr:hypothetical protein EJB05_05600 [Eragrostis curvula]